VGLHEDRQAGRRGQGGNARPLSLLRDRLEEWRARHLELAGIDFDPYGRLLTVGGRSSHLTRREAQLLDWLLDHPGQYFSSDALIQGAWEDSRLAPEQVRTYIVRLRRKLHELRAPASLVNRAHHGYALDVDRGIVPRGNHRPAS
jgi:DNA-binding response OmpR family regulator